MEVLICEYNAGLQVSSLFNWWFCENQRLTGKLLPVNGPAASPISFREIPSLEHEFGDDAMETRSFVSESVLACCEFPEITGSIWDDIVIELENNATEVLVPNSNIKLLMGIIVRRDSGAMKREVEN